MTLLEEVPSRILQESSTPVLATERLVLRAPRHEDAKTIAHLANDRRIAENTTRIPHPYQVTDATSFIAEVNRTDGEFAWLITLDDAPIGACGLAQLDGPAPDLGYWLGAPYWGNGYATEAARAVIDHAFAALGHEVLQAGARVTNPASRRVLEKCGSSGRESDSTAFARSKAPPRSTASGTTAASGRRSRAGAPAAAWREDVGSQGRKPRPCV
jgi:RimJ/RimL family protein N-acetyltransferase